MDPGRVVEDSQSAHELESAVASATSETSLVVVVDDTAPSTIDSAVVEVLVEEVKSTLVSCFWLDDEVVTPRTVVSALLIVVEVEEVG